MKYLLILVSLLFSLYAFSQKSEYNYGAIKFGYSQGFSPQPGFNKNKYLKTPLGEMQLTPVSSYPGYMPGFFASYLYNIDFPTDNAGVVIGLEYNNYGIAAKYETVNGRYSMVEKHRINAIGVPVFLKFGPKFYKKQKYAFLGAQFNFHINVSENQTPSWLNAASSIKLSPEEFNKSAFVFFAGFNWMVFNIQLNYVPSSFFNKSYEIPESLPIITPYSMQSDNMFFVKVAFNSPTNDWLPSVNYKIRKFLRKVKFW